MIGLLAAGDVCAVDVPGLADDLIRLGSELEGHPAPASHVVIVHHQDPRGRWWGIAGMPGGVGYRDMAAYTRSPLASAGNSNALQPRTDAQRALIVKAATGLLGTGYDWIAGIAADGFDDLHAPELAAALDEWWGWTDPANPELAPGHVVCSSFAAWVYRSLGLDGPKGAAELIQPSDWWRYNAALA